MKTKGKRAAVSDGKPTVLPALLCTAALIAAALGILFLSSYLLPRVPFIQDLREGVAPFPRPPDFSRLGGELGSFFALRLLLSALNLVLVVYLLYAYLKDYLRVRTSFALGLVAFLFSFLLYALSSFPAIHLLFGFRGMAGLFSFIPLLFSALGLVIFVKLSNE